MLWHKCASLLLFPLFFFWHTNISMHLWWLNPPTSLSKAWFQVGQRHKDHLLSPAASDCLKNANKATQWYYLMLSSHWSQHKFWKLMAILVLKVNVQVIQNPLNFFRLSSRWRQNFFSSHRPHLANEMHYFWTKALNGMTWLTIFFFSSTLPIKMFQIDAKTIAWVFEWSRATADP